MAEIYLTYFNLKQTIDIPVLCKQDVVGGVNEKRKAFFSFGDWVHMAGWRPTWPGPHCPAGHVSSGNCRKEYNVSFHMHVLLSVTTVYLQGIIMLKANLCVYVICCICRAWSRLLHKAFNQEKQLFLIPTPYIHIQDTNMCKYLEVSWS